MEYLIDGHNLIAAMPDIDLDEPDDEVRLVARLREWALADRRRRVLVIFDRGLVAGKDPRLSRGRVQVYFAPSGQTADSLLRRRIEQVEDPRAVTLITSDREIIAAANARRMGHMFSEAFAVRLGEDLQPAPAEPDEPTLSPAEVQEWLDLFGPVPERPPRPRKRPPRPPATPAAPPPPPASTADLKAGRAELTPEEMAEWLALFGPEPERPAPETPGATPDPGRPRRRRQPPSAPEQKPDARLSPEDLADWLAYFGDDAEA